MDVLFEDIRTTLGADSVCLPIDLDVACAPPVPPKDEGYVSLGSRNSTNEQLGAARDLELELALRDMDLGVVGADLDLGLEKGKACARQEVQGGGGGGVLSRDKAYPTRNGAVQAVS